MLTRTIPDNSDWNTFDTYLQNCPELLWVYWYRPEWFQNKVCSSRNLRVTADIKTYLL